jgi:tetratricopeptide (TPR) repeat protein
LIETARLLQAGEMEGERPWVQYVTHGLERLSAARPSAETDLLASTTDPSVIVPHPLDQRRMESLPRVFLGPIASSNTLLKNPVKRDQLRDRFGVKAVEMEGSGIADAAWNVEVQYLVIRGICDYCDRNKGDDWQVYAAVVAAAYSRALLEATPQNNQVTINPNPTDIKPLEPSRGAPNIVLSSLLDSVSSDLSEEKSDKLEELRELFREGSTKDAYEGVQNLRRSQNWLAFSSRLRAATLRALATMTLSIKGRSGIAEAEEIAEEARKTDPSKDDVTLRARIKVYAEGHAAALAELTDSITLDGFNLRLALLLDTGKIEEALDALRNPPEGITFDAEAHRLFALALLASGDIQRAREQISEALAERPRRQYIRFNAAVIDYFSTLSPLALPPFSSLTRGPFNSPWSRATS